MVFYDFGHLGQNQLKIKEISKLSLLLNIKLLLALKFSDYNQNFFFFNWNVNFPQVGICGIYVIYLLEFKK